MGKPDFDDFDRIEVRAGALFIAASQAADAGNSAVDFVSKQRPAIDAAMGEVRRLIGIGQGIGAPVPTAIAAPDAALNSLLRSGLAGQQASTEVLLLASELLGVDLAAALALDGRIPQDLLARLQRAADSTVDKWNNDARRAAEDEARRRMHAENPASSFFGDIGAWLSDQGDGFQAWLDDKFGIVGTIGGNFFGGFGKGAYDAVFTKFLGGTLDLMGRNTTSLNQLYLSLSRGDLAGAFRATQSYLGNNWTVVRSLPSGLWQFAQSVYHGTIGVPINGLIGFHNGDSVADISQNAGEDMGRIAPDAALFVASGGAGRVVGFLSDANAVGLTRAVASRIPFAGDGVLARGVNHLDDLTPGFSYVDRGVFNSPVVHASDDFVPRAQFFNNGIKYFPDGTPITDNAIVSIHGSRAGQFSVVTKVDDVVTGVHHFTPEEFAAYLKRQPGFVPGQPVTLISCEAGAGSAAQRLADALGSPVRAPRNVVATMPNGMTIEQVDVPGLGFVDLIRPDGIPVNSFQVFNPSVALGPTVITAGGGVAADTLANAGSGG